MKLWYIALALACIAQAGLAQTRTEIQQAKKVLGDLQTQSFAQEREYCGMFGVDAEGRIVASAPRRGRSDSCFPRDPRSAVEIIASYHTHGGYDPDAWSEIPSPGDVIGDVEEGVDGWISTPGGRLWFVDGQTGIARQICGIGCLPKDPSFRPDPGPPIPTRFTLKALIDYVE